MSGKAVPRARYWNDSNTRSRSTWMGAANDVPGKYPLWITETWVRVMQLSLQQLLVYQPTHRPGKRFPNFPEGVPNVLSEMGWRVRGALEQRP